MLNPKLLEQALADADAQTLAQQLRNFEINIQAHLPDEILFTSGGEPNIRNQYGAILFHVRMLSSALNNFGFQPGRRS